MSEQPEALRLADWFSNEVEDITWRDLGPDMQEEVSVYRSAAAELRRLHEVNSELVEALEFLLTCKHGEFCEHYQEAENKARAAIAKARGESNE